MQFKEHTPSITSLQDPPVPQIATNDTNYLQNITLTSSDNPHPPPKLHPLLFPPSSPTDEAAALEAHLWDRQHASDLSAYEWDPCDLVSSVHSSDDSASDEDSRPRLARRDEFEQGIRREETWSRAYRERWEEPGVFYKRKIESRLEAEGWADEEGRSCVSGDGWGGQGERGWDTPAALGGEGWDVRSRSVEGWSGVDGWASWERDGSGSWIEPECPLIQAKDGMEDLESWNGLESPTAQEMDDTTHNQGCGETDKNVGEPPLPTQKPSRIPIPKKPPLSTQKASRIPIPKISTYNESRSSPVQYYPTCSLPTAHHTTRRNTIASSTAHTSTPTTLRINEPDLTPTISDPDPIPPTPFSSTPSTPTAPTIKPNEPDITPTISDPDSIPPTPLSSTPSPPLSPTTLNNRLNTSIFKSLVLLATAHQTLHSAASIGKIPPSPTFSPSESEMGRERQRENETAKETFIESESQSGPYTPDHYPQGSHNDTVIPDTDIVRVEGWWKRKGRERWRMVGGRDCEGEEDENENENEN